MSSDDYFFDDELDSAFLNEVDAIEAAHTLPPRTTTAAVARPGSPPRQPFPARSFIDIEDSDPFDAFDFDVAVLQDIHEGRVQPPGPSKPPAQRTSSRNTIQTTLLGGVVQDTSRSKPKSSTKSSFQRTNSVQTTLTEKRTKQWDRTAFAKSGWRQTAEDKARKKGKERASFDNDDGDERVEFEQFPAPFVPIGPVPPMKLKPDLLAARQWTYPLNKPKRDYQFNIAKRCLFENTLVALPTGLGKTFIAGVVMLNFFHWFPDGKVVFLAPTKPLVAQQIDASHRVCGIPGSHAAEVTGETSRARRLCAYAEKRVFYMTPQTLLSDLISKTCDPTDIVLIVVDEAHKGTGDYAYAQVIRFMMAKNPHFRVLALTATPGSNPDAVQDIVNCLHISHIEIRNEESIDIRKYIHEKEVVTHIIPMNEDVGKLCVMLAKIMQPMIKMAQSNGALRGSSDPVMLHPFRCQNLGFELRARKAPGWTMAAVSKLQSLARAMGYLLEASTNMCYEFLNGLLSGVDSETGKKAASRTSQNSLQKNPDFQALIKEMGDQKNRGFALHPKMEKLRALLVQHFGNQMFDQEDADHGDQGAGNQEESRVMVFVSFRDCVDEVVEMLNGNSPLIRATRFVGQATDKQGKSGLAQRQQLEVIERFKSGEYNVLVSTSIGEEGLDIGEVDLIVCYDAQKTPIRMLQRAGRTGRKRAGVVHLLLAQGREDKNWEKAKEKYQNVQDFIVKADQLELYGDAERLLPDHVKPECVERVMEIEEYVREEKLSKRRPRADGAPPEKKRKRDDDPLRNVPVGTSSGFVNVKDLILKGAKGRKKRKVDVDPEKYTGEDDEDDLEIEAGIFGARRAVSTSEVTGSGKTKKLRRAKTIASTELAEKPKKKKRKIDSAPELSSSQIATLGVDDSDDAEIERGLASSSDDDLPLSRCRSHSSKPSSLPRKLKKRVTSPLEPGERSIIDLTTPRKPARSASPVISLASSPDQPLFQLGHDVDYGQLNDPSFSGPSRVSSPDQPLKLQARSTNTSTRALPAGQSTSLPSLSSASSSRSSPSDPHEGPSMAWLVDDDDEPDLQVRNSSPVQHYGASPLPDDDPLDLFRDDIISPLTKSKTMGSSPLVLCDRPSSGQRRMMAPPAVPTRKVTSQDSDMMPEPTFAIRGPVQQGKKRAVVDLSDSSPLVMPPPSQRRIRRQSESPPPSPVSRKPKKRKFKDLAEAQKANPWLDVEATHSGDERSVGSSDVENEDGYEPSFVRDMPDTQVSPSYDQSAIYRRSLMTQAPAGSRQGPVFASRPAARGWGVVGGRGTSRVVLGSPRYEDENDDYEFGSFVVQDDEDISFAAHSSSEP